MKGIFKLLVTLISFQSLTFAQSLNLIHFRTGYQDKLTYLESKLLLPAPLGKNVLLFGHDYTQINFTDRETNTSLNGHLFKVGLSFKKKVTSKSKNLVLLLPRLNFSDLSVSKWQWGGIFLHTHQISTRFKWKTGLYLNTELFSSFAVPMLGLEYDFNPRFNIKTLLPLNFHLNYMVLRDRSKVGFSFVGRVSSYSTTNTNTENPTVKETTYKEVLDNALTIYGDLKLLKNVFFRLDVGLMLGRKVEEFNETDRLNGRVSLIQFGKRKGRISSLEDGMSPYLSLSLFYRIKTGK